MDWDLRAEILNFTHRWPVIMIAFLIGSLVGAGVAYLLPAPYRAEAGLAVVYNTDAHPRNADDFKNWYLGQLEIFIYSDDVLGETLKRLQEQDPYWEAISPDNFRNAVHAYWRNAGQWRLAAEAPDPIHAEQVIQAWEAVILEKSNAAIANAVEMLNLERQYHLVVQEEADMNVRTLELTKTGEALQFWVSSKSTADPQGQVPTLERWQLLTLAARTADLNPTELELVTQPPPPEALLQAYITWVNQTLISLDNASGITQGQLATLSAQREAINQSWMKANERAKGLSAYLSIQPLNSADQAAQSARRTSTAALVGGILGVLAWGFVWLGRPLLKRGT